MAKKKISGLPAGTALNGTELVPIVQAGTTKRITTQDIANLGNASGVEGSGTINRLAKFTASSTIGNSQLFDDGTSVGLGTITPLGLLHLFKTAATTRLVMDGNAAQNRIISYRTNAVQRFGLYVNNTAESGANAGSDFAIRAYNDAGTLLSTPLFIKRSTGNVGIGNISPSNPLTITKTTNSYLLDGLKVDRDPSTPSSAIFNNFNGSTNIVSNSGTTSTFGGITFRTSDNTTVTEMARFVGATGNLLIGTSTDSTFKLDVVGTARISGASTFGAGISLSNATAPASGIQFPATQVASANANNLDDYEEGTWTMGVSFGGASVGVVYLANTGNYTKIGRQVTIVGYLVMTNKGTSTGDAKITGLPFTTSASLQQLSACSLSFQNITFLNQLHGGTDTNATTITLAETSSLGVATTITNADFANNSVIVVTLTYFV